MSPTTHSGEPLIRVSFLLATLWSGPLAAATAPGWDATKATQAIILLVAFAVAVAVGLIAVARTFSRLRASPRIDVAELRRRLDARDDLLLLDVRTAADFIGEQGHVAGATNIPLEALESRLDMLAADRKRPIAIICRTDRRSDQAAALLARRGFADVRVVEGGMTAWLGNGWLVEEAHAGTK
jgi:rhodanese-related sulfurtransferase